MDKETTVNLLRIAADLAIEAYQHRDKDIISLVDECYHYLTDIVQYGVSTRPIGKDRENEGRIG